MPIDIQCPDCEYVFGVPNSMAGKRTLCRSCNAALVVPEEEVALVAGEPEMEPTPPPRQSRRGEEPSKRPVIEKLPNWDTPIPFQSPVPIVGVLLIALFVSVLVLVAYGLAKSPTTSTKSTAPAYVPPKVEPTKPEPTKPDVKPAGYDREVILPNREVILPKFATNSTPVNSINAPHQWMVVRETNGFGSTLHVHDAARGHLAGSVPENSNRVASKGVAIAPSGRWLAQMTDTEVEVSNCRNPDEPVLKWVPYPRDGRATWKIAACVILSDERLLTVSSDSHFDLWALPSGQYIRRVAAPSPERIRAGLGYAIGFDASQLAIRDASKIEIYSLEDDTEGPLLQIVAPVGADAATSFPMQFLPGGKKIAAITAVETASGAFTDRVEIFEIAGKKRTANWTIPSQRRGADTLIWSAGADALLVQRRDLGLVSAYQLTDGKSLSTVEIGNENIRLDGPGQRLLVLAPTPIPARYHGFDLPLRAPGNFQKNPVWEYNAGVLELKKAPR